MTDAVVFLGPTLPVRRARDHLDAVYLPPAGQGDVLRSLARDPAVIVLIDGYFSSVPAVWHKELLLAMTRGVYVFGAASMGALRAAELHQFGMIGVGQVFDWFRTGVLEDDDEVAIVHAPADAAFAPHGDAMVDIRHGLRLAVDAGLLPRGTADRLTGMGKARHYTERSFATLLSDGRRAGEDAAILDALAAFLTTTMPSVKESDAIAVLDTVADHLAADPSPLQVSWTLERTAVLQTMELEIRLAAGIEGDGDGEGDGPDPETLEPDRHLVLLRLLARHVADAGGLEVTAAELRAAVNSLRRRLGLLKAADTRRWLRSAGLSLADLQEVARDEELIGKLATRYREDIVAALPNHLRLRPSTETRPR